MLMTSCQYSRKQTRANVPAIGPRTVSNVGEREQQLMQHGTNAGTCAVTANLKLAAPEAGGT